MRVLCSTAFTTVFLFWLLLLNLWCGASLSSLPFLSLCQLLIRGVFPTLGILIRSLEPTICADSFISSNFTSFYGVWYCPVHTYRRYFVEVYYLFTLRVRFNSSFFVHFRWSLASFWHYHLAWGGASYAVILYPKWLVQGEHQCK